MHNKKIKISKNILIFYKDADNMINKKKLKLNHWFQQIIQTYFVLLKLCQKNISLKIEECEIQTDAFDCFSNISNSNCHKGTAIYTKTYLNGRSYLTKVKDFQEHACCKIEASDKTSLHMCLYRSSNILLPHL